MDETEQQGTPCPTELITEKLFAENPQLAMTRKKTYAKARKKRAPDESQDAEPLEEPPPALPNPREKEPSLREEPPGSREEAPEMEEAKNLAAIYKDEAADHHTYICTWLKCYTSGTAKATKLQDTTQKILQKILLEDDNKDNVQYWIDVARQWAAKDNLALGGTCSCPEVLPGVTCCTCKRPRPRPRNSPRPPNLPRSCTRPRWREPAS